MTPDAPIRAAALLAGGALAAILALAAPAEAQRAASGPPDWPCVQRLVPELVPSTMWSGPSIEDLDEPWHRDPEIAPLVRRASALETGQEDAVVAVAAFVKEVGGDRERRLTLLFAGLFEQVSRERTRTIDAILRYSRGQVGRLERVSALVDELETALADPDAAPGRVEELEQALHWERRVFEDRQSALRALCDQPYLLEERLSRMVREIQAGL
jgi:hypothetical protein